MSRPRRVLSEDGSSAYYSKEDLIKKSKAEAKEKKVKDVPSVPKPVVGEKPLDPADKNEDGVVTNKELQAQCEELGIKWKKSWNKAKLLKMIEMEELSEDL